jgi:hypothetical protein
VKPVAQLDRMLLVQVESLHARTGKKVDVVAESEGALVAKTALLADPGAAVSTLVLASPLENPGRVSYPISSDSGWGVATEQAMQLLSNAFEGVSPVDLAPDNPFLASLDQQAPSLEMAVACPIDGIRQFALLPLADATDAPAVQQLPFQSVVLPAFHGGLLESVAGARVVSEVLAHRPVSEDKLLRLADDVISDASGAWQVPSLVPSDYPTTTNGAAVGSPSCREVAASLRAALGPQP